MERTSSISNYICASGSIDRYGIYNKAETSIINHDVSRFSKNRACIYGFYIRSRRSVSDEENDEEDPKDYEVYISSNSSPWSTSNAAWSDEDLAIISQNVLDNVYVYNTTNTNDNTGSTTNNVENTADIETLWRNVAIKRDIYTTASTTTAIKGIYTSTDRKEDGFYAATTGQA